MASKTLSLSKEHGDLLIALVDLGLPPKAMAPALMQRLHETREALAKVADALEAAKSAHTQAKAQILAALGYRVEEETVTRNPPHNAPVKIEAQA